MKLTATQRRRLDEVFGASVKGALQGIRNSLTRREGQERFPFSIEDVEDAFCRALHKKAEAVYHAAHGRSDMSAARAVEVKVMRRELLSETREKRLAITDLTRQIESLRQHLEGERAKLRWLSKAKDDRTALAQGLDAARKRRQECKAELNELEKRVDTLRYARVNRTELAQQIKQARRRLTEINGLNRRVETKTELKQQVEQARTELAELNSSVREIGRLPENWRYARVERTKLAGELRESRAALADLKLRIETETTQFIMAKHGTGARNALAAQLRYARSKLRTVREALRGDTAALIRATSIACSMDAGYQPVPAPMLHATNLKGHLPEMPGIYFLWDADTVVYVGLAVKLSKRLVLGAHHVLAPNHTVSYVQVDYYDLTWSEKYYIGALRPQLNYGQHAHHNRVPLEDGSIVPVTEIDFETATTT